MDYRIGQGNDTHELKSLKHGNIVLGGYTLKSDWKIFSHSDGDIVLHSLSNAILGALQLGDIGEYFSDTDYRNKNLDSRKILAFAINKLKKAEFKIVNIDLTITCENIFFGRIKKDIKKSLEKLLKTKLINVKATRFEHPSNKIKCETIVLIGSN